MKCIRFGICILTAFAVLAHGAMEVWSESALEIGAAALFLLWAIIAFADPELKIPWNDLGWPMLGLLGLGIVQLGLGWTAYSYFTREELFRITAYFLVFFLATQAFREKKTIRAFVWFLVTLCFAVGLFGIIQYFTFNGKLYWFRELTVGGNPFGPYVNRNHFAGFIELTLPLGISLLVFRGTRRDVIPLTALFTIVPVGALFLAGSRGGTVSFVFELGLLGFLMWMRRSKIKVRLWTGAVVLLAAGVLVAWLGVGQVVSRFGELRPGEVSATRRVGMLKDTWHILLDHPWKGIGLGTLEYVYPRYESIYDGKVVDHSHNDYIEVLAETGVPGAIFGLLFLVLFFRRVTQRIEAEQSSFSLAVHAGALVACGGMFVHSFVDFNLHVPSNAILFLLEVALATSPTLERSSRELVRGPHLHRTETAQLRALE
jgi:O-antigen ligase